MKTLHEKAINFNISNRFRIMCGTSFVSILCVKCTHSFHIHRHRITCANYRVYFKASHFSLSHTYSIGLVVCSAVLNPDTYDVRIFRTEWQSRTFQCLSNQDNTHHQAKTIREWKRLKKQIISSREESFFVRRNPTLMQVSVRCLHNLVI